MGWQWNSKKGQSPSLEGTPGRERSRLLPFVSPALVLNTHALWTTLWVTGAGYQPTLAIKPKMSQPQKLCNFPPLKLRLLPTSQAGRQMKASRALDLASQELLLTLFLCSCSEKWARRIREEVIWGARTSALWAQCKFLWFSTEALWKDLLHRQYEILKRFLGTTSKKIFMPTLLSIPRRTAFLVWRHSNFIYTCCFRPGLVQGFSSDDG